MPNLRVVDVLALYHRHLSLDDQRYDLRQGLWRSCSSPKIKDAIAEAYSLKGGQEFKYPTIFEKAAALAIHLYKNQAFEHDCFDVSIEVAIQLIESSGLSFHRSPRIPQDTTLAVYLKRCSVER